MKRILFLSTFVFLGFRLNSCSDTDLDSPVNETNQPVENNTSDITVSYTHLTLPTTPYV